MSVGNTGGFSLANEGEANVMSDYMPGSPIYGGNVDLSSTANGIVTIPDGQELVFKVWYALSAKTRKENCGYKP